MGLDYVERDLTANPRHHWLSANTGRCRTPPLARGQGNQMSLHDARSGTNEPVIICPNCKTEIRLTESLASPLIEATRQQYEQKIAQKEAEVANREAAIREQQAEITKARDSLDERVTAKLKTERENIAAEEAKKARLILATDLEQKAKEIIDLQEVLKERDSKLAEAQKVQADPVHTGLYYLCQVGEHRQD